MFLNLDPNQLILNLSRMNYCRVVPIESTEESSSSKSQVIFGFSGETLSLTFETEEANSLYKKISLLLEQRPSLTDL